MQQGRTINTGFSPVVQLITAVVSTLLSRANPQPPCKTTISQVLTATDQRRQHMAGESCHEETMHGGISDFFIQRVYGRKWGRGQTQHVVKRAGYRTQRRQTEWVIYIDIV